MTAATGQFLLPDGLPRPVPSPDGLDAPYWEGTLAHELRVQRCGPCGAWQWGPEWICHRCHSRDRAFEAVSPTGVVYSWTRVWHPAHPAVTHAVPYIVLVVELPQADGVRVVGNLMPGADGPLAEDAVIPIGAPATAVFEDHPASESLAAPAFTLVHWRL